MSPEPSDLDMLKPSRTLKAVSWSSTLHLPKNSFPLRPLQSKHPDYLKRCTDDLYARQAVERVKQPTFTLHDGPPYANGDLHIGHALNKILKDIFCRFQLSQGKRVHFVPGWDCHGLPIEIKALQEPENQLSEAGPVAVREAARKLATSTVEKQKQGFKEWAIMGDWDQAYRSMDHAFEVRQLRVFKDMVGKGLIKREFKPVYWSPSSRTALAEAELEYDEDHKSLAAYIKFKLTKLPTALSRFASGNVYGLIWTTTPWTLPANRAIAVHKDIKYSVLESQDRHEYLLVAQSRVDETLRAAGMQVGTDVKAALATVMGSDLIHGTEYTSLLEANSCRPLIHADFVSASSGTGLVHIAPGHGMDDFHACSALGIVASAPVDDEGRFTEVVLPDAGKLPGMSVLEGGSRAVLDLLSVVSERNMVWATHEYRHKYPMDWRTKRPVIIRATSQWFADVAAIKRDAMRALEEVKFVPASARTRLQTFVEGRSHWCISRQRSWGVPIPALYKVGSKDPNATMTAESLQHILHVIDERGTSAWWTDAQDDPAWIPPELAGRGTYVRGQDTMDVWFDSGTSWTQLPDPFGVDAPADLYLEGTDQHRGWFQSSLLTHLVHQSSLGQRNSANQGSGADSQAVPRALHAPYKMLITHGFVLDHEGRKMSKSVGNVVHPDQIMSGALLPKVRTKKKNRVRDRVMPQTGEYDGLGPDALRLWVALSDYTHDVTVGQTILQAVNGTLHKLRITIKWLLGVLDDFHPAANLKAIYQNRQNALQQTVEPGIGVDLVDLTLSDRVGLHQLSVVTQDVHAAYASFSPLQAMTKLNSYIVKDLSSFYMETAKDVLYAGTAQERFESQYVCARVLAELLNMLAPVTPLLVEETLDRASATLLQQLRSYGGIPSQRKWSPFVFHSEPFREPLASPYTSEQGGEDDVERPEFTSEESAGLQFHVGSEMALLDGLRSMISRVQEDARSKKQIGSSLECDVEIRFPASLPGGKDTSAANQTRERLRRWLAQLSGSGELARYFVVSRVSVVVAETSDFLEINQQNQAEELLLGVAPFSIDSARDVCSLGSSTVHGRVALSGSTGLGAPVDGFVSLLKAQGGKCPRCWRSVVREQDGMIAGSLVDSNGPERQAICGRCRTALEERGLLKT